MSRFAEPPMPRDQHVLIPHTLDDLIPKEHSVRLFVEILDLVNWSGWLRHYVLVEGRPPIHPKVIAAVILYGMTMGIRSSRRLEYMCDHAIDFMWLTQGQHLDHSKICEFRTQFKKELKDLFKQINRVAIRMGLMQLNQINLDGTQARANSSRHRTASAQTLEQRLQKLDEQMDKFMAEWEANDQKDLFGNPISSPLPNELADLTRRQEELQKAFAHAQAADAKRKGKDGKKKKKSAKVPVADPDSSILPNKDGGFAPNYTTLCATESENGMIVDAQVLDQSQSEPEVVIATVDRIEADYGQKAERVLADGNFATGSNLTDLEERQIESYMPVHSQGVADDNPAQRPDPTVPVPHEDRAKLPHRKQSHKLDRSAFMYVEAEDRYYCPEGRPLDYAETKQKHRECGAPSTYRVYRSASCEGCSLAGECLSGDAKTRTVSRDQHDGAREATAQRMKTESGKAIYASRAPLVETNFALIKEWMGFRQFLLRGIEKVRTEWLWACTAFNLKKMIHAMRRLRVRPA
ncbi:MAG: IS1182 family transposase [Phycisphaerae bacterium]|nr:IS1182 family transposase [Phycisphaerae bacterium]